MNIIQIFYDNMAEQYDRLFADDAAFCKRMQPRDPEKPCGIRLLSAGCDCTEIRNAQTITKNVCAFLF